MKKKKGWTGEPGMHSLAARGVKTGTKYKTDPIPKLTPQKVADLVIADIGDDWNLSYARLALEASNYSDDEIDGIMEDVFSDESLGQIRDALEALFEEEPHFKMRAYEANR